MIRNFTPHAINILNEKNEVIATFESEGVVRVTEEIQIFSNRNGVPIAKRKLGEVVGMPAIDEDDLIIVSSMVIAALPEDENLVCPADFVRNDKGIILGCRCLTF